MPASLLLTLALALPVAKDDADDQYNFIVGLAEKGLSEMVVKEATTFLADNADCFSLETLSGIVSGQAGA